LRDAVTLPACEELTGKSRPGTSVARQVATLMAGEITP
jgi:hypothetical protein